MAYIYSDSRFKKTLRVSRNTFGLFLEPIRHRLERGRNVNEDSIAPKEIFA